VINKKTSKSSFLSGKADAGIFERRTTLHRHTLNSLTAEGISTLRKDFKKIYLFSLSLSLSSHHTYILPLPLSRDFTMTRIEEQTREKVLKAQ
jgi:hypothetical protein